MDEKPGGGLSRRSARILATASLATAALLGAGVALVPRAHHDATVEQPAPANNASAELEGYVRRTQARLDRLPGDWQGWAQLGMAQLQLARITADPSRYDSASIALRRSLAVRPTGNAAALTGLGALAAARHEFRSALGYARRAVAADHWSADAYGVLTDANVELGRYGQATAAVQRMLDLRPDTGSFGRASYLFELRGDTARATELMRRALSVADGPADVVFARTHLGELAFNAGNLDAAAAQVAAGLGHRPQDPGLLSLRARVAAARGDLPGAVADLRTITAILPTVEHLVALSDDLTAAGRPAEARQTDDLVRASARLPRSTDLDLVHFYADRGPAGEAVARGKALLAARPSAPVESAYAWALHSAGRDREALRYADRGLRLGTRDARAHYHRAEIRIALGDRAGARADLRRALAINPFFAPLAAPRARARLAELDGPA